MSPAPLPLTFEAVRRQLCALVKRGHELELADLFPGLGRATDPAAVADQVRELLALLDAMTEEERACSTPPGTARRAEIARRAGVAPAVLDEFFQQLGDINDVVFEMRRPARFPPPADPPPEEGASD